MQVAGRSMHRLVCLISVSAFMIAVMAASAEDVPQTRRRRLTRLLMRDCAQRRFRAQVFVRDLKAYRLKRPISHVTSNSLNPSCTRRLSRAWIIPKWTVSVAIVTEAS